MMYSESKHSVKRQDSGSVTVSNIKGTFERDGLGIRFDASFDRISLSYLNGKPLLEVRQYGDELLCKLEGKSLSIKKQLTTTTPFVKSGGKREVSIHLNPEEIKEIKPGYELALVPELTAWMYMEPNEEGQGGADPEGRGKMAGDFGWGVPLPENEEDGGASFIDIIGTIGAIAAGVGLIVLAIFGARECEAAGGTWTQQPEGGWKCSW